MTKLPRTQKQAIEYHLRNSKSITSLEAIKEYGATRLSSIIFDLKDAGWNITKETETHKNRFGNSVSIARYYWNG
tara:strand:+ start:229 stop:453 length:225 start_codon:yes stop_codon:yes gene_type:complete